MQYIKTTSDDTVWYEIDAGFRFKSTPGHGWIVLDSYRLKQMKQRHPELVLSPPLHGHMSCYEEDCEISLVILAFWQVLRTHFSIATAIQSVARWYPVMFTKWVLRCVLTGEIEQLLDVVPADTMVRFKPEDTLFKPEVTFEEFVNGVVAFKNELIEQFPEVQVD